MSFFVQGGIMRPPSDGGLKTTQDQEGDFRKVEIREEP